MLVPSFFIIEAEFLDCQDYGTVEFFDLTICAWTVWTCELVVRLDYSEEMFYHFIVEMGSVIT
jgi:hypothetical protein